MHRSCVGCSPRLVYALAIIVAAAGGGLRAEDYPIAIKDVKLGFPPGPFAADKDQFLFKAGKWAPIDITLEFRAGKAIADSRIDIVAGVPDVDDVISEVRLRMDLPKSTDNQTVHLRGELYLKPSGAATSLAVRVQGAANGKPLAEAVTRSLNGLPPSRHLLLSVGSTLAGMRLPNLEGQASEANEQNNALRNGWVQLACADGLPGRWFGYDGVDLLILNADFGKAIGNDPALGAAIAEWVERGGRLLVCGAAAHDLRLLDRAGDPFPLQADAQADRRVSEVPMILPNSPRLVLKEAPSGAIPLTAIRPAGGRHPRTRLLADERDKPYPLVVQTSFGLGRVTFVTFDLDRAPFDAWTARAGFWEWLLETASTRLPSGADRGDDSLRDEEDRYLTRLQNNLESFENVANVSFGWVALLILFYILLIGPIEYLILKRLFKRLELTWLTFPIIAGSTCALTYIAAVDLKGTELRINKIDLVDIDLRGQRIYGRSWFTLFSPRIQNFTIGLEPTIVPAKPADVLVSWHGLARGGRQSLFRRSYRYHTAGDAYADGLEQVPMQIWSTKSFVARWSAQAATPMFESTLRIAEADPNQITGSITSNMPEEVLLEAQLIYRDKVVPVPPLVRGMPRFLSSNERDMGATSWLHGAITHKDLIPSSARQAHWEFADEPNFDLWPILFHELVGGQFGRHWNASVRDLDESWRVGAKDEHEAILIVRLPPSSGPADELSNSPRSPARLWLGAIPAAGTNRPPIDGTMRQETYIRVYIPILPKADS